MIRTLAALVLLLIATSTPTTVRAAQAPQAAVATATSVAAPAPEVIDLTGTWVGTILIPEKDKRTPASLHAVLNHTGATLTGTAGSSTSMQRAFTNGGIQATQFGTTITFDLPGPNFVMEFQLRPAEGMLRGVARLPGVAATASVELRRVDPNARARASNVSGTWIGTFGTDDGEHLLHVVLAQAGTTITGTAGPHAYAQLPITHGKVETTDAGTTVTFQMDLADQQVVMLFALTLTDTGLKGSITASQNGEQEAGSVELKPVK